MFTITVLFFFSSLIMIFLLITILTTYQHNLILFSKSIMLLSLAITYHFYSPFNLLHIYFFYSEKYISLSLSQQIVLFDSFWLCRALFIAVIFLHFSISDIKIKRMRRLKTNAHSDIFFFDMFGYFRQSNINWLFLPV